MMRALNPQIVKSEGSGDRERMLRLAMLGCKLSFFLLAFFAIPFIIEMPIILKIWLKTVPENSVIFCRLILSLSLVQQLTAGLMVAINSVGKVKVYQIVMGSLLILNLPLAYCLIKLGFPPYSVLISAFFIEFIALCSRIWLTHKIAGLNITGFIFKILFRSIISSVLATLFACIPILLLDDSIPRAALVILISIISLSFFGILIAFTSVEKKRISELFFTFVLKFRNQII